MSCRPGASYALVHRLALGSKLGEILVQFLVEAANGKNLALESAEPELVPQQQVIQRPVDGPEEGLATLLAIRIGHPCADLVKALIHPAIVGCHELGLLWSHRCCLLAGLWISKLLAIVRKEDTRLRRIFAGFKVRRLPTARSKSAADPEDAAVTLGCRRGPRSPRGIARAFRPHPDQVVARIAAARLRPNPAGRCPGQSIDAACYRAIQRVADKARVLRDCNERNPCVRQNRFHRESDVPRTGVAIGSIPDGAALKRLSILDDAISRCKSG